ncbi:MAG: hypothetical protein ABIB47_05395, partial [Candidatus Woesearchaeota archaeon]
MKKEGSGDTLVLILVIIVLLGLGFVGNNIGGKAVGSIFGKFDILDTELKDDKLSVKIEAGSNNVLGFMARVFDENREEITECTALKSLKAFDIEWVEFDCNRDVFNIEFLEVYPCRDASCNGVYELYKEEFVFREEGLKIEKQKDLSRQIISEIPTQEMNVNFFQTRRSYDETSEQLYHPIFRQETGEDIFPYGEPALPSHFSQTRLRDNVLIDNRFQEQQFNGYIVRLKEEP